MSRFNRGMRMRSTTRIPTSIVIPSTLTLTGGTSQLTAVVKDNAGAPMAGVSPDAWSSSTPSVATVSNTGLVTFAAVGNTNVTATKTTAFGTITSNVCAVTDTVDSGEPVYTAATDTIILQENFDEYASANDMWVNRNRAGAHLSQGDNTGEDPAGISLIAGRNGIGNACRATFVGTNQEVHDLVSRNMPDMVNVTTVIQDWRRVTLGVPLADLDPAISLKWMMLWQNDPSFGSTRFQFNTHDHLPWPVALTKNCLLQAIQGGYNTDDQGVQPVGPFVTDVMNGGLWLPWTFMYRPHTSMTQLDGFARCWINHTEVLRIRADAVGQTPPGGQKEWCSQTDLNKLSLSLAGTSILTTVNSLEWWDVYTGNNIPSFTLDLDDVFVFTRP